MRKRLVHLPSAVDSESLSVNVTGYIYIYTIYIYISTVLYNKTQSLFARDTIMSKSPLVRKPIPNISYLRTLGNPRGRTKQYPYSIPVPY